MAASIRPATAADLPQLQEVYARARQFMRAGGNLTQWGDGDRPEDRLAGDIAKGQLYVIESGGTVHASFAFILGDDPLYDVIRQGQWLCDRPYGTIHRLASDGALQGVLSLVVSFCRTQCSHLRADTHEDNAVMRHLLEKNGFLRCGIVRAADDTPRIAYELV